MKKNYSKLVIDAVLGVVFALLFDHRVLGGITFHEVVGLAICGGVFVHVLLNAKWVKKVTGAIFSPSTTAKIRFEYILNALLLIDLVVIVASGVFISKALFPDFAASNRMPLMQPIHISSSCIGLIMIGIHVGLHRYWLLGTCRKALHIKKRTNVGRAIANVAMAAVLVFGLFNMMRVGFLEKTAMAFGGDSITAVDGGQGSGQGRGQGLGDGSGQGQGLGDGSGRGQGLGDGTGQGRGDGSGRGQGAGQGKDTNVETSESAASSSEQGGVPAGQDSANGGGAGQGQGDGTGQGLGGGTGQGLGGGTGQGRGDGVGQGRGDGSGQGKNRVDAVETASSETADPAVVGSEVASAASDDVVESTGAGSASDDVVEPTAAGSASVQLAPDDSKPEDQPTPQRVQRKEVNPVELAITYLSIVAVFAVITGYIEMAIIKLRASRRQ